MIHSVGSWPLFKTTRWLCYVMGSVVIALAGMLYLTDQTINTVYQHLEHIFSVGFIVLFIALVGISIYAGWRTGVDRDSRFWHEAGQQAAAGVATLALTFTLLGISLGIGSLSNQSITPETVQGIIQRLTQHFSMAFMTTVVGLPTANVLRAFIALQLARRVDQSSFDEAGIAKH